jgi:outer membrane autotransporter protein
MPSTSHASEAAESKVLRKASRRPIYYFDVVHDYPAIGGVVEFSELLFRQLKKRYGKRLISAREAAQRFGAPDATMPYLDRERRVAEILARVDPHSTFFFPNFHSPIARRADGHGPTIINVIHDVQFAFLPELYSEARLRWLERAFARTRENADHVVFISHAAEQQYTQRFGVPRRHTVIYNPIEIDRAASTTLDDGAPFLLASIHNHPHKNFSGLLALFAKLAERSPELNLVVTGHGGEAFASHLAHLPASVAARVRHLGYVPRKELDGLYRRARAFVTLSRFEGFNMSAAEAASHGTSLILSDLPVHRELFSEQACFVDPMTPSVDAVEDYLAAHAGRSVAWPLHKVCAPSAVGSAYADVIDRCACACETSPEQDTGRGVLGGMVRDAVSRASGAAMARALLCTTMLVGAASAALAAPPAPVSGLSDGGKGGGYAGFGGHQEGVDGGTGYMGDAGEDGSAGSPYFGGGGGGAGGGVGGLGDIFTCAPMLCSVPGLGGAGGTAVSPDGEDGVSPNYAGGGGGGGGGFHGNGFTGVLGTVDLVGGRGGNGGDSLNASAPGSGGGGGAGGYGAVLTGTPTLDSAINLTGGRGGDGGSSAFFSFSGGSGGDGGVGLFFADPGAVFTGSGSITGGEGGTGGVANGSSPSVHGGRGGDGGAGVAGSGVTVRVEGQVTGGTGGLGGASVNGIEGENGNGGAGISGSDLTIINAGTISGGLSGSGVRANAITFTGGANALTFEAATTGLVGDIAINGAGSLTFDQADGVDVTVDTVIMGDGSVIKDGDGTVILTGTNTYTGGTSITGGVLSVNGSIVGDTSVGNGGTLKGTGLLESVTVGSGGVHAPGNSIGTQTVTGAYTLQAGSILEIEANAAGQSDQVVVNGTVDLTGSILRVLAEAGTYAPSTGYVIIANDGVDAVTGTFSTTTTNLAFLTASVNYAAGDGNDVELTLLRNDTGIDEVALTPNQSAVAAFLNGLSPGHPLYDAIVALSENEARVAFDAFSGEVHASVLGVLLQDSKQLRDVLFSRLWQAVRGSGAGSGAGSGQPTTVAARDDALPGRMALGAGRRGEEAPALARSSTLAFWAQAYGSWGEFDGDRNAAGVDRSVGGFVSGMDAALGGGWRAGFATGYGQSNVDVAARLSSADIESYHLAAYAGGKLGGFALRTGASWTWHDVETERAIVFPGFANRVEASYDADTGQIFAEVALPLQVRSVAFEPFAGLAGVHVDSDGFAETGGLGALTAASSNEDTGYSTLGVRAETQIRTNGLLLLPRISVAWQHAFDDVTPVTALAFASGGPGFTIAGTPIAQDSALLEAGLGIVLGPDATLGVSYHGEFADETQDHGVSGRLDWRF